MDQINLTNLITPAIVITVFAYLTRFFGKVIEDQNSFSDDKKWSVEIKGIVFMMDVIPFSMIGIYFATLKPWSNHWLLHFITFIVISLITFILQLNNTYMVSKFYNMFTHNIEKLEEKRAYIIIKEFTKLNKYLSVGLISAILLYFATLEYLSGNIYFIVAYFPAIFLIFTFLASNFSLKKSIKNKIVPVDIYFTDQNREPLRDVIVLKYNPDNIRVRMGNKILFLNKNEVFKIEMVIPEEML